MPRLGSTIKSGEKTPSPLPDALRKAGLDAGHVYAPLAEEVRARAAESVALTVDHIRKIQTSTRDRNGRIKRAKFKAAVLALRWEGFKPKETAEILGASIDQVEWALKQMREDASIDSQLDRLDQIIVPLALDNVVRGVLDGDKEYTLKVLDGRGVFRSYKSVDAQVRKTVLKLEIKTTMPAHLAPDSIPMPNQGAIVGTPWEPKIVGAASTVPVQPVGKPVVVEDLT